MDLKQYLNGPQVELPQMLAARERRGQIQAQLLAQHPMTLISFTLNIAGPVKVFPLSSWAFDEGVRQIQDLCAAYGFPICHGEELREDAGCEFFLCVDSPAPQVKTALMTLEEENPLGRLFDLDVLDSRGSKMSREALGGRERTCLICGSPVFLCSRNRAHSLEAIQERTCQILEEAYQIQRGKIAARLAAAALLQEVQITPKPGLVDLANTGAHRDMDVDTFTQSALALLPFFEEFFACSGQPETLLPRLREIGIRAERSMRSATGGVNTHKGMIFSMGILLAALSRFNGWSERPTLDNLRDMCKKIAAPLTADFESLSGSTHGGCLYQKYGIRGARGEALAGFPALFKVGHPALAQWKNARTNDAGVAALLAIMASLPDTNMISRSTPERAAQIREDLTAFLETKPSMEEILQKAETLDETFIPENISPGGSADILALAIFLHSLERKGLVR